MRDLDRREFLKYSADVAGRAVAGFAALNATMLYPSGRLRRKHRPIAGQGDGGYGKLRKAGPELALPEGFSYHVFGVEGLFMSDGYPTPGRHDGMCAFPLPNGNIRLLRNHEVENNPAPDAAIGDPAVAYDPGAGGGVTALDIDPATRELIRDFVVLNGTWRNCSGGPTPWGSWLSCEEGFFGPETGFADYHGYVFEVPATRETCEWTEPLIGMGRFVHEAVAVDPPSGIIYQTEDFLDIRRSAGFERGGFYRFLPNKPYRDGEIGDLRAGGRLQMLGVRNQPRYDTATRQVAGRTMPVRWIDIEEPNPLGGPDDHSAVFDEGFSRGGARFTRLEGCWYDDGRVYFVATDGGDEELGQVWQFRATGPDDGELTLIFESRNRRVLKKPDNVCVSPNGVIVMCEDADERRQYIRGLTQDGKIFDIASSEMNHLELAGVTFSPDSQTMFCNTLGDRDRKRPGMTFAIWGPWERGAV
jgi:secreted PhoX family phosphatase